MPNQGLPSYRENNTLDDEFVRDCSNSSNYPVAVDVKKKDDVLDEEAHATLTESFLDLAHLSICKF